MEGRLLLDVVVAQRAPVLQLLAGEDESLLVRWDPLLVLDLGLDVLNRVRGLNLERDGLARERLHENLRRRTENGERLSLRDHASTTHPKETCVQANPEGKKGNLKSK